MRIVSVNIYTVNELSKQIKKKVIDNFRTINVYNVVWYETLYSEWVSLWEERGVYISHDDIEWTGGYSTEDELSFTCRNFDLNTLSKWVDNEYNTDYGKYIRLIESHTDIELDPVLTKFKYSHITNEETPTLFNMQYSELCGISHDMVIQWHKQTQLVFKLEMVRMFRQLCDQYEYLTSDEEVINTLYKDRYEFYENGNIISPLLK